MAERVILHIGGEKTGTTTLQNFLTRNSSRLLQRNFYYPSEVDNICFEAIGHFPVAACLLNKKADFVSEKANAKLPFVLESLSRLVRTSKHSVILSCEHFSSRLDTRKQLRELRDALGADKIEVIYYIREPSELALAYWSTAVRGGARDPFNINDVTPNRRYYNHLKTLNLWASVFGMTNLIVREYDRDFLIGGDIRNDFCAVTGIEFAHLEVEEDLNQSFDAQRLETLRYINGALPQFHEDEAEWRRAQKIRELVSAYIPQGAPLNDFMSNQDRTLVKSRFAAVNAEINEKFLKGRLSPKWFPNAAKCEEDVHSVKGNFDLESVLLEAILRMAEAKTQDECVSREMSDQIARGKIGARFKKLLEKFKHGFAQSAF